MKFLNRKKPNQKCDNTYVREETLAELFIDVVSQIRVNSETVAEIKKTLPDSQRGY